LARAYDWRIREAVLKSQNYDKGMDRFVRHDNPEEEPGAAISIQKGKFIDHGWAVYFKQDCLRCLLNE
jgi:hypothetical protein